MIFCKFTLPTISSPPNIADTSSSPKSPQFSNFWISYMTTFFPGWPNHQSLGEYFFSLFLVFLLAFTTEFCSNNYPFKFNIKQQSYRLKGLLSDAVLHGLRMFMAYLLIISVITTDFVFLLVALAGHTAGSLIIKLYEYNIDQAVEASLAATCQVDNA